MQRKLNPPWDNSSGWFWTQAVQWESSKHHQKSIIMRIDSGDRFPSTDASISHCENGRAQDEDQECCSRQGDG